MQRRKISAPGDERLYVAFELVDEAAQIVQPAPLGARIGDADERGAGLHLAPGRDGSERPDLALDRRAQRDQAGIDDSLGA